MKSRAYAKLLPNAYGQTWADFARARDRYPINRLGIVNFTREISEKSSMLTKFTARYRIGMTFRYLEISFICVFNMFRARNKYRPIKLGLLGEAFVRRDFLSAEVFRRDIRDLSAEKKYRCMPTKLVPRYFNIFPDIEKFKNRNACKWSFRETI